MMSLADRKISSGIWTIAAGLAFVAAACSRPKEEPRPLASPPAPSSFASAPVVPRDGFGTVMADVARRFELLGRASLGGRYELAEYERGEINELFTDALPYTESPKEGHPEVLPPMVTAFAQNTLPDLERAIASHDRAQVTSAFARAAEACNACHRASGHGFIEVPSAPGKSIPSTEGAGAGR